MELLLLLAARNGHLVTRAEIAKQLWDQEVFVDTEHGINTAIRKIRLVLKDDSDRPRFVETVTGKGYRFIGALEEGPPEVESCAGAEELAISRQSGSVEIPQIIDTGSMQGQRFIAPVAAVMNPADDPVPETSSPIARQALSAESFSPLGSSNSKSRSHWWKASLAVLALMVAIPSIWLGQRWRARNQTSQGTPAIASLAVLPLTNLTGDPSQTYFVDGMTDELTTSLAQLGGLKVTSETSAKHYRDTSKPLQQIAQELGVDAIVEGSVARFGDQVRVTAQLIDAKDDRHLWAESFSRSGGDALGLQHDVARVIAKQIHLTLTPAEAHRLASLPTRNQEAYDAYLRAKYLVATGLSVEADADGAVAEAERAVALDPEFAKAYVVAAQGYSARMFSWGGGKGDDEKAFVALGKALAQNPNLAEAYSTRGTLYYTHFHNFDIANAVADYWRALSLNPNFAEAHQNLGSDFTHSGLHDRAIKEFKTTLRLDPQNEGAKVRLSRALWQSGRFTESLENYDRYNEKSVEKVLPMVYLGLRKQAWDIMLEPTPQIDGNFRARQNAEDAPAVRALLYAMDGNAPKAQHEIEKAEQLGKSDAHFHHAAFIIAAAYAEMSEPHKAVQWLRRTAETGMPNYPLFRDNPSMKKLYGNPDYEQFMAEFKPRWDQFAAKLGERDDTPALPE